MYWLLSDSDRDAVRKDIELLTARLSQLVERPLQADQLFPFVGRKDMRKAAAVLDVLLKQGGRALDPFSGSGIFTYAAVSAGKEIRSNEWDPYTWRMSTAPWRVPSKKAVNHAMQLLSNRAEASINNLYRTICTCGSPIIADSVFFDRIPLRYTNITTHERLGSNGENVTFRGRYKCPKCGATEKFFDYADLSTLDRVNRIALSPTALEIFNSPLIENSRININKAFLRYGNFFPYRSQVALDILWNAISQLNVGSSEKDFLKDAFLSIIPQAKYKDYRSKSQDLHVPERQLREVNLWSRFINQVNNRLKRLHQYNFYSKGVCPVECRDFREFLQKQVDESVSLVFTDPPWTDGNAYFEKSQLYNPWLGYSLADDAERLSNEVVVTDAPSRSEVHNEDRWWRDIGEFFTLSAAKTKPLGYLAVYFRPIPASRWLQNLNRLKYEARKAGWEPLLTIDVASKDPSMRIQQSASFTFSSDLVFVFLKLPNEIQRYFMKGHDLDYLAFKVGSHLQQYLRAPFMREEWERALYSECEAEGLNELSLPKNSGLRNTLFERYMREVNSGLYLVKPDTPFNGQLFDIPAQERLFSFVPAIVDELTREGASFSYESFLLKLAGYVENGTRMLISSIQSVDITRLLLPYAEPLEDGKFFRKRVVPSLSVSVRKLHDLDPYDFERFAAHLLEAQGFTRVALMGGSGDRGVDIVALDPKGATTIVQCKRYLQNVSADPIQRLHSFAVTRNAKRKIVITTAGFTRDAIDEANRTGTELIDGSKLHELVVRFMPNFLKR